VENLLEESHGAHLVELWRERPGILTSWDVESDQGCTNILWG